MRLLRQTLAQPNASIARSGDQAQEAQFRRGFHEQVVRIVLIAESTEAVE